jgi:hypothetical protein
MRGNRDMNKQQQMKEEMNGKKEKQN